MRAFLILSLFALAFVIQSCTVIQKRDVCERIDEIRVIPFKNERVDDEVYNGILTMGDNAIPCLINQLTSTVPMDDPRKSPRYKHVTTGDVALFILMDISDMEIDDILPGEILAQYKTDGIYAYFNYVEKNPNRKAIQTKVTQWFEANRTSLQSGDE